jgi:hypothetical protein
MVTSLVCLTWEIGSILLTPIAVLIEWITSIPVVGRLIDEIINVLSEVVLRLAALPDVLLGLIGIEPVKKLRLCVIILKDEEGKPTSSMKLLRPALDEAARIFREEANVIIVEEGIHEVDGPSPKEALDVGCGLDAWGQDLWLTGSYFEATAAWHCALGAVGRTSGVGNPVVVFCVRSVTGNTGGCSLGPAADYVTIEGPAPLCLAHEVGHAAGLWHCCASTNLANAVCGGQQLKKWQRLIVRNSKYVSYV